MQTALVHLSSTSPMLSVSADPALTEFWSCSFDFICIYMYYKDKLYLDKLLGWRNYLKWFSKTDFILDFYFVQLLWK